MSGMQYPEEWRGLVILGLESYFTPYIKQANPKASVFIIPDPMASWPPEAFWNDEADQATLIMLPEEELAERPLTDAEKRQVLAVLAHEAAHAAEALIPVSKYKTLVDIPSTETSAFVSGVKWALRWGVLAEYEHLFNTRGAQYLNSLLENPSYSYTSKRLQEDILKIRHAIHSARGAVA